MAVVRIAVASTPLTATLDEAVPAAVPAVQQAAAQGAALVCLPETGLPGHRNQTREVPDVSAGDIDDALTEVSRAAGERASRRSSDSSRRTAAGR